MSAAASGEPPAGTGRLRVLQKFRAPAGAVIAWDSIKARSWATSTQTLLPVLRSSCAAWDAALAEGAIAPHTTSESPSPIRADRLPGAMAALCPARPGAYLGRVVLATGQDGTQYPPGAGRLPVPLSAILMAGFGPQLPCCATAVDVGSLPCHSPRHILQLVPSAQR